MTCLILCRVTQEPIPAVNGRGLGEWTIESHPIESQISVLVWDRKKPQFTYISIVILFNYTTSMCSRKTTTVKTSFTWGFKTSYGMITAVQPCAVPQIYLEIICFLMFKFYFLDIETLAFKSGQLSQTTAWMTWPFCCQTKYLI